MSTAEVTPDDLQSLESVAVQAPTSNEVANAREGKNLKRYASYGAGIALIATTVVTGAATLMQSKGEGSSHKSHVSQPDAKMETERGPAPTVVAQTSTVEEVKTVTVSPEEIKEQAGNLWKKVQTAAHAKDITSDLAKMDALLAEVSLAREDIGATPEAVKETYMRLAKSEWDRAVYFHGIRFGFKFGALSEVKAALAAIGATHEDIGVSAEQFAEISAPFVDKDKSEGNE